MALIVSDDLRFLFLFVTGDDFPDTNEDLLRALADAWEQAGRRLRDEMAPELRRAIALIGSTFQGQAAQAFLAKMAPFVLGKDNYINSSAAFFFGIAAILRQLALDAEYMKYVVILELVTLQNEFFWAFAAGAVLGPLVLTWLTGRVVMTRTALETLLEWFNLRLGTMGEKASVGQELLIGMTMSTSNQLAITAGAQGLQFLKGTRTEWTPEYFSDAAVVGVVGGLLLPPALEFGRIVAKVTRSVTELLDAVLRKAHGARDWHQGFAVGVAHIFRESMHEGSTATIANAILTQQVNPNWSDFTAGASSGVARVSGHLLGHTTRKPGTAKAPATADTAPSPPGKPESGATSNDTYPDVDPGTTIPPPPHTSGPAGSKDPHHGPDPDEKAQRPHKPKTAPKTVPKSVVESVLPKTIPPKMAGGRPRPRLDIAGIASRFPKTLLEDPNRRKTAETIVASTHHVDKLRQTGHYDHTLLAVAGTAEGSGTGKATQLSLRVAYQWETNLPPVAPGGAPAPATVSSWSQDHTKIAEDRYGLSSWAPRFRDLAGQTDAGQLFAALDYQAGHQPGEPGSSTATGNAATGNTTAGRAAPGAVFSSQPPEEIEGGLLGVYDRIAKAGQGARAIVFVPPGAAKPGSVWHIVYEPGGVRLKQHDGAQATALPEETGPVVAVGLDAKDNVVIADTIDARWNTTGLDDTLPQNQKVLATLTDGERNRRLQRAATLSWATADLSSLTDARRFTLIRATTQAMTTAQVKGKPRLGIERAQQFIEDLARQLRITWPEEKNTEGEAPDPWTFRRIAQNALNTAEARPDQLGDEYAAIARDVLDTAFDRATLQRLGLDSAIFRLLLHEARTEGKDAATALATTIARDPEFARPYLWDQAKRVEAAFTTPDALAEARTVVVRTHNLAKLELANLSKDVTILVAAKLNDGEQAALDYSRQLARLLGTTPQHHTTRGPQWTEERALTAGDRAARTLDPAEVHRLRRQVDTIVQRYAAGPELTRTPGLRHAINALITEVLLGPGPYARKRAKATRLAREISHDLKLGWTPENFRQAAGLAGNASKPPQTLVDHARDWVRRRHSPGKFDGKDITEPEIIAVVAVTAQTAGITADDLHISAQENRTLTEEERLTMAAADRLVEAIAAALADGLDTAAEDPHLWLEDLTSEAVKNWVTARNAEINAALTQTEDFARIRDKIRETYASDDKFFYANHIGDHFYNFWKDGKNKRGLWRRTTLEEYRKKKPTWETLLDLDKLAADEGKDWAWAGSRTLEPDRALISLSLGGEDKYIVREFDLVERRFVKDGFTLLEPAEHYVSWIDRDRIYVGTDFPGEKSFTKSGFARIVKEWHRGQPLSEAKTVHEGKDEDNSVAAYRDGTPGYERDFVVRRLDRWRSEKFLRGPGDRLVRLEVPSDATTTVRRDWLLIWVQSPWTVARQEYRAGTLLVTNFDDYLHGKRDLTVLFEPDARTSLQSHVWTRDHLLLTTLSDVQTKIRVLTPADGWRSTPLAGARANSMMTVLDTDPDSNNEYQLQTVSFTEPATLTYGHVGGEVHTLRSGKAWFDAEGLIVEQHTAVSLDGTRIPYFVVRHKDAKDSPRPTLLTGYGGFRRSLFPRYLEEEGIGWFSRGGAYVAANIRGGAEYGPGWHTPTLKEGRHLVYEDFAAVAADLIKRGITTSDLLGIEGGSNGGLLMGVMLTRYPELFGAVASLGPLLDMRRFHLLLTGAAWKTEYGDPDDPAQWDFMKPFSPYENLYREREYPPVFIMTRGLDDRVHPGHGRKMTARMMEYGHDVVYYESAGGHANVAGYESLVVEQTIEFEFLWSALTSAERAVRAEHASLPGGTPRPAGAEPQQRG